MPIGQKLFAAFFRERSACLLGLAALWPSAALAQATSLDQQFTALWHQNTMLGDMGGLRPTLGNYGISLGLQETSEVFGNVSGGVSRGAAYDGVTELSLGLDTARAFGWQGGSFNISAWQIHGRSLSADNLYNLQTVSGIEANRATRLWELWYQQSFLEGRADVKLGQQSIDQEFMGSLYSGLFANTMMGWPMLPSADLYAGGPAYPLSSLGVRLRGQPTDQITVLGGVFEDNPPGGPFDDDSQVRGAEQSGTKFNLHSGALFIGEVQYAINQPATGQMVSTTPQPGLPGTYKLGFWYDTAQFPDQNLGTDGLSLADPSSNGSPALHRGNYSVYAVADQMVWRPDPQSTRSVGVFARVMGAPDDRNLISFSANAGVVMRAPFTGRDSDSAGIGFGIAQVSRSASELDAETGSFSGTPYPVRGAETFLELTYQYQINPWWQVQPDAQYVFNTGGGVLNPNNQARRLGDEAVFGLRTNIVF